jgi:hypothetical protein
MAPAMSMEYFLEMVPVVVDNTAAVAHIQHALDTEEVVEMDSCSHTMRALDHMRETSLVVGCIDVAGIGFVCDVEPYRRPQSLLLVPGVYAVAAGEISSFCEGDRRWRGLQSREPRYLQLHHPQLLLLVFSILLVVLDLDLG